MIHIRVFTFRHRPTGLGEKWWSGTDYVFDLTFVEWRFQENAGTDLSSMSISECAVIFLSRASGSS